MELLFLLLNASFAVCETMGNRWKQEHWNVLKRKLPFFVLQMELSKMFGFCFFFHLLFLYPFPLQAGLLFQRMKFQSVTFAFVGRKRIQSILLSPPTSLILVVPFVESLSNIVSTHALFLATVLVRI